MPGQIRFPSTMNPPPANQNLPRESNLNLSYRDPVMPCLACRRWLTCLSARPILT